MSKLPEGWVEAPLGDLLAPIETTDPRKSPSEPFIYVDIGSIDNASNTITDPKNMLGAEAPSRARRVIRANDVLFSTVRTYLKNIARVPAHLDGQVTSTGVAVLRAMDEIDPGYLFRLVTSNGFIDEVSRSQDGTLYPATTDKKLAATNVPVAPAPEQKRIAAKIDSLTAKSARARTELTKIEALVERYKAAVLASAFDGSLSDRAPGVASSASIRENLLSDLERHQTAEMAEWNQSLSAWEQGSRSEKRPVKPRRVAPPSPISETQSSRMWSLPQDWDWVQIGSMAFVTKLAGFEYTKHVTYDDRGDLPVLKAENAGPHGFRATDYSRVVSSSVASLRRSQIFGGEVLVVFVGAGVGNVAAVPTGTRFFLGPNIGMVRPYGKHLNPKYIEYFLRSEGGKSLLLSEAKAVAQPSISMGAIRNTPVPMCHLDEQLEIVHRIEAAFARIDLLATEAQKAAKLTSRLDQRILAHAFRGSLTQQNPADEPAKELLARIRSSQTNLSNRSVKSRGVKLAADEVAG